MIARRVAAFAYLLLLAALTLWPQEAHAVDFPGLCLLCGERGLADGILNVLLFVPLGLLLPGRWLRLLGTAAALSVGIEVAQLFIPGRHPTPADVLYNVLGAAAGMGLGRISTFLLHPSRYWGDRLAAVLAIVAASTIPLAAWLYERELPEPPYRVEWETARPRLVEYPGSVLAGGVGGLFLTPGPSARGEVAKELLERGAALVSVVELGPPPEGVAPVLALYDPGDRMVALLGVDGGDLVYRERTRASGLRLDNPESRLRGALDTLAAGDTVRLGHTTRDAGRCFIVGRATSCGHGIAGTQAWRFLYALNGASEERITAVDILWLALLFFPVGYWARWHLAAGLGAMVAGYAWLRAPADLGLLPVPPMELTGIAAGVVLGLLARALVRRRPRPATESPHPRSAGA